MNTLTTEHVKKAAKLARIAIQENEIEYFQKQLEIVFEWIGQLAEVDTSTVDLDASDNLNHSVTRADVVTEGGIQNEILANSPVRTPMDFFVVPKVIE